MQRKPSPTSIKEKETHWLKRAVSPLHHKEEIRRASRDLEGCQRPSAPDRSAKSNLVFNSAPSGIKLVGILYRMCMEVTCKLANLLVVEALPWH
eukprot:1158275-Pelagomonas_calceolata.AAC.4